MQNKNEILQSAWSLYQAKLLGFIKSKINNQQDAEDILSNVFVNLLKEVDKASDNNLPDNLSAWLYRVSKNKIIDYYRTRKVNDELPDNLMSEQQEASSIKQLSRCMLPMINLLPDEYKQILTLSEIEGMTQKATAQELSLSLSAVKSRVLRGRKLLYKSLLQCCVIERNHQNEVVSFTQKSPSNCDNC